MKEGKLIFILSLLLVVSIFFYYYLSYNGQSPQFSPPTQLHIPSDCGQAAVQALWGDVFNEPSAGIIVVSDNNIVSGQCDKLFAYKTKNFAEVFMLSVVTNATSQLKTTYITSYHGNFTVSFINNLNFLAEGGYGDVSGSLLNSQGKIVDNPAFMNGNVLNRIPALADSAQASANYVLYFKETPSTWSSDSEKYGFSNQYTGTQNDRKVDGYIYINKVYENTHLFDFVTFGSCTSNWMPQNTSCIQNKITQYWTDSNNCNNEINRPANQTFECANCAVWVAQNTSCSGGSLTTFWTNSNSSCSTPGVPPQNQTFSCGTACTSNWRAYNSTCSNGNFTQYWVDTNCSSSPDASHQNITFGCSLCNTYWRQQNTSCLSSDYITTFWTNSNLSCTDTTGFPTNISSDCDYQNLGIIGTESEIRGINIDPQILIEGEEVDYSQNYTGTQTIEIRDDSISRVIFDHNFGSNDLNLRKIKITKQPASSSFGYLVVDGIDDDKAFYLDRKNSSSARVCVKDRHSATIASFSSNCGSVNEYLVNCPGSNDRFSCTQLGNLFIVSGLTNSAVKEFVNNTLTVSQSSQPVNQQQCISSWTCSFWSVCSNNIQTRTCTDSNNCNQTYDNRKTETQTCSSYTSPTTAPATDSPNNSLIPILIVALVLIIAIIVVVVLLLMKRKKSRSDDSPRYSVNQSPPPNRPGPFMPPRFPTRQQKPLAVRQ